MVFQVIKSTTSIRLIRRTAQSFSHASPVNTARSAATFGITSACVFPGDARPHEARIEVTSSTTSATVRYFLRGAKTGIVGSASFNGALEIGLNAFEFKPFELPIRLSGIISNL